MRALAYVEKIRVGTEQWKFIPYIRLVNRRNFRDIA